MVLNVYNFIMFIISLRKFSNNWPEMRVSFVVLGSYLHRESVWTSSHGRRYDSTTFWWFLFVIVSPLSHSWCSHYFSDIQSVSDSLTCSFFSLHLLVLPFKYWYIFVVLYFFGLHGLDKTIDNVTLRLWKFSGFCSRHTVGIAGDDTTYHILIACVYFCHEVVRTI